jgi:hypothetical protein
MKIVEIYLYDKIKKLSLVEKNWPFLNEENAINISFPICLLIV